MKLTCWARCGGHRHELAGDVDLVGDDVGDARIGRLVDELDLLRIVEQALGDDLGDVDVEAGEIAGLVAEMPGRVGAAGADDQLAARQHVGKLVGLRGTRPTASVAARSPAQ